MEMVKSERKTEDLTQTKDYKEVTWKHTILYHNQTNFKKCEQRDFAWKVSAGSGSYGLLS